MTALLDRIGREPVLSANVIRTLLLAGMAFGLGFSAEQVAVVAMAAEQLFSWYVRTSVTPEVVAVEREQVAKDAGRAEVTAELAVLAATEPEAEVADVVAAKAPAKKAAGRKR